MLWFKRHLPNYTIDKIKSNTQILFIDDQEFDIIEIIKENGWINTKRIPDIKRIHDINIETAHIIFVDIHGVGRELKFKNEGLGLIKLLKEEYPLKTVIVYSANEYGNRFDKYFELADKRLPKNAEPYEFLRLIEDIALDYFSSDRIVKRIRNIYIKETNVQISYKEVMKKTNKLYFTKELDESIIKKVFKVENIQVILMIMQILKIFKDFQQ